MTVHNKLLSAVLLLSTVAALPAMAADEKKDASDPLAEGKAIAFDRGRGNCLACHTIADGQSPGTIGPPLIVMKQRYPDKAKLRAQIWDATVANPRTPMPPFGRHEILTEAEIDKVVEYIWSL